MFQTWISKELSSPSIWVENKCISFGDLATKIKDLSLKISKLGVKAHDRVAFIAETNLNSILLFFALLEISASPCLLSSRLPLQSIPSHLKLARASFFLDPKTLLIEKCEQVSSFKENAILLFTSGSSGIPKLVSLKLEHFIESAKGSVERLGLLDKKGCWLLSVPLFHVSGLSILFRCFLSGSSIVLTSSLLSGHSFITHLSLVPTQLLRIIEKKSFFPLLRCALIGGAPLSEGLVKVALQKEIPLYLTYGMTETASQITMTSHSDTLLPLHVGKTLPGKEVKLSEEGEILVRGSSLFSGYDSCHGLQKPFLEGGWFPTRDLGSWNQEGNLEYRGRKDNMFISGGENIYPETIEKTLNSIPGVLESLVVPLEDPEFGHRPVAFVHMEEKMVSKEEFQEKLSSLLPKFSLPIHFFPFPQSGQEGNFKWKRSELKNWLKTFLLEQR